MSKSTYMFPVARGLLEHRAQIGPAIWEYLWLVDRVTRDAPDGNGNFDGIVLDGSPVAAAIIATDLKESTRTTLANLRRLEREGFIRRSRSPGGSYSYIITRSKKWLPQRRRAERDKSPTTQEEKCPSPQEENGATRNSNLHEDSLGTGGPHAETWQCNKEEIQKIENNTEAYRGACDFHATPRSTPTQNPASPEAGKTAQKPIPEGRIMAQQRGKSRVAGAGDRTPPAPRKIEHGAEEISATEAWQRICGQIRLKLQPHLFDTWLKPTHGVKIEGTTLHVAVPAVQGFGDYIAGKYGPMILEAVATLSLPLSDVSLRSNPAEPVTPVTLGAR